MITILLILAIWLACGLYAFIIWQDFAEYSNDEVTVWSFSYFCSNLWYGPINIWRYYSLKRALKILHMLGDSLDQELGKRND